MQPLPIMPQKRVQQESATRSWPVSRPLPIPVFDDVFDSMESQASVPRDVFPPTPPGPEGSNGNGLFRVQWSAGAWLVCTCGDGRLARPSRAQLHLRLQQLGRKSCHDQEEIAKRP